MVIVLQKPSQIKNTITEIRKSSVYVPILTTPNSTLLGYSCGIYFFNDRLMDLSVNVFLNNLAGLENDIMHVDYQYQYQGINLRTEMVGILSVINELMTVPPLKYSFYDNAKLHLTGYSNDRKFTFSCFISNCSEDGGFNETITVYTKHNGTFKLGPGGNLERHTYSERYGACWDKMVEIICNKRDTRFLLQQEKIIDMLKIDRSLGGGGSKRHHTGLR